MKRIYMDNAATSYPKAPGVSESVKDAIDKSINLSRTESDRAWSEEEAIDDLRASIASYYGSNDRDAIAFTRNVTEAINWAIKGFLKKGDKVIVSPYEHNAVMRPLLQIGAIPIRLKAANNGYIDYLNSDIPNDAKAIFISAASNVTGAIQDLAPAAEIAKKKNLLLFVDAAQYKANLEALNATAICFTGHKGLLGPMGTGGLVLKREAAFRIDPLIAGGTGSHSDSLDIPSTLPDRLSPGTENIPALIGLKTAILYRERHSKELEESERERTAELYEGLLKLKVKIHGPSINERRTNVISISTAKDEAEVAAILFERYGIETRVGLHCAPEAHRAIGTFPRGTLRFSPGPFTTKDEIEITLKALEEIINE